MNKDYRVITSQILDELKKFNEQELYTQELYNEFEHQTGKMRRSIQNSMQENRLLKIGIVGEVKAGKSSFLNALIFDGEDILPKASTPMTAALTKISYSHKPQAIVHYYTRKDWADIEKYSGEYDSAFENYIEKVKKFRSQKSAAASNEAVEKINTKELEKQFRNEASQMLKSCKELTDMYNASSISLRDRLVEDPKKDGGEVIDLSSGDLSTSLADYIGAGGKFTPIVNYVELKVDNEALKDIEIIDTPGLNDPIASRGWKTKEFLRECDVVFLLSYTGQFLTDEDIKFIKKTLPFEGIRESVIIGSKLDSGLLDENKIKSINAAYTSSVSKYNRQAGENISRCLGEAPDSDILRKLKASLPPSYISSLLYNCAVKQKGGKAPDKGEAHLLEQLKAHFPDFDDDYKSLISLSGIPKIWKERLNPVIENKEAIIREKSANILSDNQNRFLSILEDISIQAEKQKNELQTSDMESLNAKINNIKNAMNSIRRDIKHIFESSALDIQNKFRELELEIEEDTLSDSYTGISVSKKQTESTYTTGFWIFKQKHTVPITHNTANPQEVISNIRKFIISSEKDIQKILEEIMNELTNENGITKKMKEVIVSNIDASDKSFDADDILQPLELTVKRMTALPKFDIDIDCFINDIKHQFSSNEVMDSEIHALARAQSDVLDKCSEAIIDRLETICSDISGKFIKESASFTDTIIRQNQEQVDKISKQLKDKEENIKRYDLLLSSVKKYKEQVKEMEIEIEEI